MSKRRARQLTRAQAQPPHQLPEIILSPNLGKLPPRPECESSRPPIIRLDHWSDFTESLRPYIARVVRRIRTGRP